MPSVDLVFSRYESACCTLRSIGDGVIAADRQRAITFMNAAAERMTGWTSAVALGKPFDDVFVIVGEGSRERIESPVDRVLREGRVVELPTHALLVRADGEELAVADSAAPLRLDDGTIAGAVLVFRDVSAERRQAKREEFLARVSAALSASLDDETTLRTVADVAVLGFADCCAVDLVDGSVARRVALAHADPSKLTLVEELERCGLSDSDATGTWLGRLGIAARAPERARGVLEITPAVIESVARSDAHRELLHLLSFRSFVEVPVSVSGKVVCVMTFAMMGSSRRHECRDVSTTRLLADRVASAIDSARLYREAQRMREEAQLANDAKDEFLAMLGHELRNPLAPIASAVELVRMRAGSSVQHELTVIDRQLRHVVRLVDDLLDVSRITHGRVPLQREEVDLFDVISSAVERSRPLIDERHHELLVTAEPGLVVIGDLERLTQAVGNLLANAAKYTRSRGRIEVSTYRVADRIAVRVADNGMGITPEMMPRVFDFFVQDPRSLDRSEGGLGLGLGIVRELISAHDGTVTAASDGLGKGSVFVIELPELPVTERARSEDVPSAAGWQLQPVLVVDDNVDAAHLLAESLRLLGDDAYQSHDAESAVALASAVRPSVALLDIGLPDIDGYELARRLRRLEGLEDIVLIAVTGYGEASDRDRSRAARFDAHLVKPVAIQTVLALIENLHEGRRLQSSFAKATHRRTPAVDRRARR